jgi:hypothetical protein
MKDVTTFLAEVAESRLREQAAARAGFEAPPDLSLPHALEVALANRLFICPILAHSAVAADSARVGVPCCEREQIEYWFTRYGSAANWLLNPAASGVVAVDIELPLAGHSLLLLARNDRSWQQSLQFRGQGKRYVLFKHTGGQASIDGRYRGLRIHVSDSILIPPSRTLLSEMSYANESSLLPAPDWLYRDPGLSF